MKSNGVGLGAFAWLGVGFWVANFPVGAQLSFSDVTLEAGITHVHRFEPAIFESIWMAAGGVAEDFDGDGWMDLYALEGAFGVNHLYINQGNGSFVDEAFARGAALDGNYFGATAADYDNDGDADIFVTRRSDSPVLLRNNGVGVFTIVPMAIPERFGDAMSASWGDVDNDGLLDLMIGVWGREGDNLLVYRNTGSGFESYVFRSAPYKDKFVFSPRFADVNNDRWTDLLVVCDFGNSQLYLNTGNGVFDRVTASHGIGSDENGMGSAVGDYDNDGDLDWFVSSIWDASGVVEGNWGVTGNRLYNNLGDGRFTNVTLAAGVHDGNWGWGSGFADFDNDGYLDIYHVNGWPEARSPGAAAKFNNQPARLFRNQGDGTFQEGAAAAGAANTGQGRGLILFDYDNDGDMDIFIGNNQELVLSPPSRSPGRPALLRNDSPATHSWIKVTLAGTPPLHRDGIGSRVHVTSGLQSQMRELNASTGFLAHGPARVAHFGLGSQTLIDEVRAEWISGDATVLRNVPVNTNLRLSSPMATLSRRDYQIGENVTASGAAAEPLGAARRWVVEGRVLRDPLSTSFSSVGRKDLELQVFEPDGVTLLRAEVLRIDVRSFSVLPEFVAESASLTLVWRAVPGWHYQVEGCTNVIDSDWVQISAPLFEDEEGNLRVTIGTVGRGAFYRVRAEQ